MTSFCSLNDVTSLIVTTNLLQKSQQTKMYRFSIKDHPSNYFQQNNVFETILPDFHIIVVTELEMGFQKLKLHIVAHRDFKHFDDSEKF